VTDFVLIHGAGTGGWLWDDVAGRLRDLGHVVHTPTLAGVGERVGDGGPETDVSAHVAEVHRLIQDGNLTDAVLVGFSDGGLVIAGVAELVPHRVGEVVFLDAFVPQPGICLFDLFPPQVRATMEASAEDGWRLAPLPVAAVGGLGALEPGIEENHVLATLDRRGAHPAGTYRQTMTPAFQHSANVARRYISCTDKQPGDPLVAIAGALRGAGWHVDELPTGHFSMLTMPARLTELLNAPR
jgi:pimeloyl-ACP methyl ester carboxylesterase